MLNTISSSLLALSLLSQYTSAQCPNQVANFNPNLRTQTSNSTIFIVPVDKAVVQQALDAVYFPPGTVTLASVPTTDTSFFLDGFPEGKHPVYVYAGYSADIRMSVLQINGALLGAGLYVRRSNSKAGTVLSAELSAYISGPNGQTLPGVVPGLVSTMLDGYPLCLGKVTPNNAAYQVNSGGILSNNVAWNVLENLISGPGVQPEAYNFQYTKQTTFKWYTAKLFKAVLNQPTILSGAHLLTNTCQRNQYYFNNATGAMTAVTGDVTFGPAADGALVQMQGILQKAVSGGVYSGNEGFTACAQNIGYNPENCDTAAKNVDQAAV